MSMCNHVNIYPYVLFTFHIQDFLYLLWSFLPQGEILNPHTLQVESDSFFFNYKQEYINVIVCGVCMDYLPLHTVKMALCARAFSYLGVLASPRAMPSPVEL